MKNKQTVLIIDDIADNLNVAANTLIPHGINVILAQNGREAIKTATKFLPDLILLDIMMPEMNGFEVCASLKEIDKTKEIPVIFLTAVGETKNIVKGFELGAVDYINKPFISEELISRVKAHLKIHQLNKDLNLKNDEIKNKHNEILSSIRYAQIIQKALLPKQSKIDDALHKSFIFFRPKEDVSGDFYYVNKFRENIVFAVADCTGHGVPGGFLSMLGINFLNQVIKSSKNIVPSVVLEDLREFIKNIFDNTEAQNNGMDIAFCSINFETNIIHYSGANISLFLVRKGEITEYKSTKNPAGSFIAEYAFSDYEIQLEKNDLIYLFSDGYADQFGEVEDKRFKKSKLKKLLLSNASKPIQEQKRILEEVFDNWKLNEDQTDDVLVFGLEI